MVPAPFSHSQGEACLLRDLHSDKAATFPGTWQVSYPFAHLVIGTVAEAATVDHEGAPCSSATILNKVLKVVTSTQGPDGIIAHQASYTKPANLGPHCRLSNILLIGANKA